MKRLALLLPVLALGCADNASSIEIQAICIPDAGCSAGSTCGSYIIANPTLDSAATKWMMLFFQVANQLPPAGNTAAGKLPTNDAWIDAAEITFSGALGGSVVLGANGYVPAQGTTVIGIEVVPGAIGAALPAPPAWPNVTQATAKLRLRGHYKDTTRFETAEFPVTIDVTAGAPQTATCAGACPQTGQYPAACP